MTVRTPILLVGALFLTALTGACGDPFTQPACYGGPGCGEDNTPPVAEITDPAPYSVVHGNFWLNVTATDDHGVLGMDVYQDVFKLNPTMVTKPPYRFLVDPTAIAPTPGQCDGPRDLSVQVFDVAGNIDTLYLTVNFQRIPHQC